MSVTSTKAYGNGTAQVTPNFDHVRVYQSGSRTWGWCKQTNGCGRHAYELFGTEFEAALTAASVAQAARLPLRVSSTMRRLLTARWYAQGWRKAADGKARDLCANRYEARGFDEYMAEHREPVGAVVVEDWPVYAVLEAVAS